MIPPDGGDKGGSLSSVTAYGFRFVETDQENDSRCVA
jgi:hypothetical protein